MADSNISLGNVYLFGHLSDMELKEVEAVLRPRSLQSGEVLFNLGDQGDELYLVVRGKIAIYVPDPDRPGHEKPIRIFDREDALGEMALIDRKPRSLSARAIEPSEVLAFGLADFERLIKANPQMAFAVMSGLSDRIRYTTEFLNRVRTWVGRMTQGEYQQPDFISEMRGWMTNIAQGNYDLDQPSGGYKDETLTALATEFAQMMAEVKQREDALRQEIVELKIEIDSRKREEEVKRVTETDSFKELRDRVKQMRDQMDEE